MRTYPLIALSVVALVALVIATVAMLVFSRVVSTWGWRDGLVYATNLAMIIWTPVLALIALAEGRFRPRHIGQSYGRSAVIASALAVLLLVARCLNHAALLRFRGLTAFRPLPHFFESYPVAYRVYEAPAAAASAVAAVWIALVITGTGRRPSNWLDWICLFWGLMWVLWYVIGRSIMVRSPWSV